MYLQLREAIFPILIFSESKEISVAFNGMQEMRTQVSLLSCNGK